MNSKLSIVVAVVALLVALPLGVLIAVGAGAGDEPAIETHSVGLDGATAAEVEVRMEAGELRLGAGAEGLMDGAFFSSLEGWGPEIAYAVDGDVGRLAIGQAADPGFVAPWDWGEVDNAWSIRLGDAVPIALAVELGAGENALTLGGLDLTALAIETGVGATTVDLDGAWTRDLRASIQAGAGDLTIVVPAETGVVVRAEVGTGTVAVDGLIERDGAWVNEAYGVAPVTLEIDVDGGVGDIDVIMESGA